MDTARPTDYFDKLGDKFEAYMSNYDVEQRLSLVFSELLGNRMLEGAEVLEVGCGTGRFSERIVSLGAELTALDIGPGLVQDVAHRLSCRGVVGDACDLPFANESFDIVISSECVEHTLDPEKAIREMCRVCRASGLVCITSPNRIWYPTLVIARKLGLRKFLGIENWMWPHKAAAIMLNEGMKNIVIRGCHLWPFQIRFTRPLLRRLDRFGKRLYPLMINFGILAQKGNRPKV